ncbi:hypothetical protein CDAR_90631 [Caerostris darwini]|uniref:Uncharacterized protein n=1 Tax=Caerostris darwini TaxID=1538125 RepID=A0AAV4SW13_9ARAC|nr:hypothetical protein CDAR_90631 [Caerostris darwini]
MSTKEILFSLSPESGIPKIPAKKNSCQKNICASWDNTIGSIIAVSALIAMFSVLSSFGKARNQNRRTLKGNPSYVVCKQICRLPAVFTEGVMHVVEESFLDSFSTSSLLT